MSIPGLDAGRRSGRQVHRSVRAVGSVVLVLLVAGCGTSQGQAAARIPDPAAEAAVDGAGPAEPPTLGSAEIADLSISDGYVREPANPSVAAAYLAIGNDGETDDRLLSVSTPSAASVVPMTESGDSTTTEMADLGEVVLPGRSRFPFEPGSAHLMLMHPDPLRPGDTVSLTLTFEHAGAVTVELPVVPLMGAAR